MTPLLPKEMLWTDLKTMHQFYELDPVNEDFVEVLTLLRNTHPNTIPSTLIVFNELYYQITRMVYEHPAPRDLKHYEDDIRGNLGMGFMVELVMTMLYFLTSLIDNKEQRLNRFVAITIKEKYEKCSYWEPFKNFYNQIRRIKKVTYIFNPHPVPPEVLAGSYVNWSLVTQNYDNGAIVEILNLWDNDKDRQMLVDMIKSSINFSTPKLQKTYYNQVNSILKSNLFTHSANPLGNSDLQTRLAQLDTKVMMLEKENVVFQNLVKELQADNDKLRTLLKKNKNDGEDRKFTLVEIVNYGKKCSAIEAKLIAYMLNILLRKIGTDEDYKLVDEIETEVKNKKSGDIVMGNKNVFDGSALQIAINSEGQIDVNSLLKILTPEMRNQITEALRNDG